MAFTATNSKRRKVPPAVRRLLSSVYLQSHSHAAIPSLCIHGSGLLVLAPLAFWRGKDGTHPLNLDPEAQ